jgi:hypothetical protein
VNVRLCTPAENIAAILQDAARTGVPTMIAGSWEPRLSSTTSPPIVPTAASGTCQTYPVILGDSERLEYEREGGGAPSQRLVGQLRLTLSGSGILRRLWSIPWMRWRRPA